MGRGGFRVHVGDDACTWCLIDVFGVDTLR